MTILAIDQGTTSTKAFILDDEGELRLVGRSHHAQYHPAPGQVEHDAEELASGIESLIDKALRDEPEIAGIALANQGETVVAWDRRNKKPLCRAIVWQDQRTQSMLNALGSDARDYIRTRAGLPADAYFSASKLSWLLRKVPQVAEAACGGYLGLATSDSFFIDRLTNEYMTDVTTASRTSLMDLHALTWDPELCRIFGVPFDLLPPIRPSTGRLAVIARSGRSIPLVASLVDQQAALFGHGCRVRGDAKVTFGTGAFVMTITGPSPVVDQKGMAPTVAWQHSGEEARYALDAGDFTAAAAVGWTMSLGLACSLGDFDLAQEPSALERGLAFVPALAGLAAPHWDRTASGMWIGLRQDTTAAHMRRAVLEGIALRSAELIEGLPLSCDRPISADGGLASNGGFVQFLADALGSPVQLKLTHELTSLGAAEMGFVGLGCSPPGRAPDGDRLICPSAASPRIRSLRAIFSKAVQMSREFGRLTGKAD
jgi:glycerol kinase